MTKSGFLGQSSAKLATDQEAASCKLVPYLLPNLCRFVMGTAADDSFDLDGTDSIAGFAKSTVDPETVREDSNAFLLGMAGPGTRPHPLPDAMKVGSAT